VLVYLLRPFLTPDPPFGKLPPRRAGRTCFSGETPPASERQVEDFKLFEN